MGDTEFVRETDCLKRQREVDDKINNICVDLRQESKEDLQRVYNKIDRLYYAGVMLIITSLITIALTLFSLLMSGKP